MYKLTKKGITVLHNFAGGADGCNPLGTPAMDKAGNLYGVTSGCGFSASGIVWKVSKKGKETILHSFAGNSSEGCYPEGGVIRDSSGNLYGSTYGCGADYYGTVWKLSDGGLQLLHSFVDTDGAGPIGDLLRDSKGRLFGTTVAGGAYSGSSTGNGTVWKYQP
jgi:uncharacterized repeat protein (TIGR03803 family)